MDDRMESEVMEVVEVAEEEEEGVVSLAEVVAKPVQEVDNEE